MERVTGEYGMQLLDVLRARGLAGGAEGVLHLDKKGKVLSANRAAESLLGYGAGQLTNTYFSDFWAGSYPLRRLMPERSRPEQARSQDAELTRRDGELLPVSLTVAPAAKGESVVSFVGRSGAGRADTEQLGAALQQVQRLAGIGTLTASVAHELTNPISIITATCTNLLDEVNDETISREDLVRYVELIEHSAFRAARIVEVLRNYAPGAAQAGLEAEGETAVAITSPEGIVQDALMMVEQQFRKQAGVTIETDLQHAPRTIFCDHHRLTQVLINLLTNARDAMQPGGGTVRVRFWTPDLARERPLAERAGELPSTGSAAQTPDLFAFSVSDSGTGITPAVMERLYEPFFTTKPNGQGTGLGLYIAEGIIREHGGCLWAENNEGGGAMFTALLPRKQ